MTDYWDIINYLKPGGIVMIPLLILSFFMWISILEKYAVFRKFDSKKGEEAEIVSEFVKIFLEEKTGSRKTDSAVLKKNLISAKNLIRKNLGIISVLCAVAPLFGLLGTVTGMINTFDVINVYGNGNSSGMASGIKEALITTQGGLFIAIPGVFAGAFLKKKADEFENKIEVAAAKIKRRYINQREL